MDCYKGEKIHDCICGDGCPHWEAVNIFTSEGCCRYCGEKKYRGSECTCPETAVTREPADECCDIASGEFFYEEERIEDSSEGNENHL